MRGKEELREVVKRKLDFKSTKPFTAQLAGTALAIVCIKGGTTSMGQKHPANMEELRTYAVDRLVVLFPLRGGDGI
jgi:hypothetical protein